MSKQTDNLIQEIFSGKNALFFLIGWIVLGVLGNAVFSIVTKFVEDNISSNKYAVWLATFFIALILLWIIVVQLKKRLYRQTTKLLVKQTHPEKHKGLIVLVSRREPSAAAIE